MKFLNVKLTNERLVPASRLQDASAQVDFAPDSQSESWFFFLLRGFIILCWTAVGKSVMAKFQPMVDQVCHWVFVRLQRLGEWRTRPTANDAPPNLVTGEQPSPVRNLSPRKSSWSYLRGLCMVFTFRGVIVTNRVCVGISLALSELCQDDNFGGDRIPLSAILDLSTSYIHPLPRKNELKSRSEAASKRVCSAGASCGEGRSQAAHPPRTFEYI